MSDIKLMQGDCLEKMKEIPAESIDCILTSPPYNIGNMHSNRTQYGTYKNNNMKETNYQKWQVNFLNECYRVLKKTGYMFYNHKVRIKNGLAIHPLEWISKTQFLLKQEIIWDMGKSANCDKIRFFPFSERIYWLTRNKDTKINNINNLSDVIRCVPINNRKVNKHIAVMPEYISDILLDSVINCNIVLDPFLGTGTTAISSIKHKMDFIGIELDENYFNIAKERIEKTLKEKQND